jgi:hypothetical protein
MKRKAQFFILVTIILSVLTGACSRAGAPPQAVHSHDSHNAANPTARGAANSAKPAATEKPKPRIPAFQSAEGAKNLPPTLAPELFQGTVRTAYQIVREIPETIAQLPCYCHCDLSAGHKSLYSCFVDDHGANCGVCMNEAMTAYKLQKEQKLTPAQIREKIIEEYSKSNARH